MGAEQNKAEGSAPSIPLYTPETANMPEQAYWAGCAPNTSVTGKAAEEVYDRVLTWWATNYPEEVSAFESYMEKIRARRGEEGRVFTRDSRAYRHAAEIPAKVYHALGFALGNSQWILDEGVRAGFLRRFRDCLTVRHRPGLQKDGGGH